MVLQCHKLSLQRALTGAYLGLAHAAQDVTGFCRFVVLAVTEQRVTEQPEKQRNTPLPSFRCVEEGCVDNSPPTLVLR